MLPAPTVTILDGNRFLVADAHGDACGGSDGLYADDVRVLHRWRMRVDGVRPALLGGGEDGGHHPGRCTARSSTRRIPAPRR